MDQFVIFKDKIDREKDEQRIRQRARIIQAEDDARKRHEEDAQRDIERRAVDEYKKQRQEQETRSAENRETFRNELERLGLETAQIQSLMESANLNFEAAGNTTIVPEVQPSLAPEELSGEPEATPLATSGRSRPNLQW